MKIDPNNPFIATWNSSNASLNRENDGILTKVKDLVFYIPNLAVAACLNPRSETSFSPHSWTYHGYTAFSKEIITPDQVHLVADVHISDDANNTTPTVILFNCLGTNHDIHGDLNYKLTAKKCNVVAFDYRGLGSTRRAKDLVIDGESVYQFVTQELEIESDHVHFFGFSLGGVTAAQVKALHPECKGKYVGDRPFKSIFSFITENCCIAKLGVLIKKITSLVASIFLAFPLYFLGWEWDGSHALKVLKGEIRVVYHPNDILVPFEASMASECTSDQLIRLDSTESGFATHFEPIAEKFTDDGRHAIKVIANFLAN